MRPTKTATLSGVASSAGLGAMANGEYAMKFRYYITDLFDGEVKGTNSADVAANYAAGEDCFVVDAKTGHWLQVDGESAEVQEASAQQGVTGPEGVIRIFTARDGTVFIHETEAVVTCPCYSDEESDMETYTLERDNARDIRFTG
jgi:hypothetical protein